MAANTQNTSYSKTVLLGNFCVISKAIPSANTRGRLSFESMNMKNTFEKSYKHLKTPVLIYFIWQCQMNSRIIVFPFDFLFEDFSSEDPTSVFND